MRYSLILIVVFCLNLELYGNDRKFNVSIVFESGVTFVVDKNDTKFYKGMISYHLISPYYLGYDMGIHGGVWTDKKSGAAPYFFGAHVDLIVQPFNIFNVYLGANIDTKQHSKHGGPNSTECYYSGGVNFYWNSFLLKLGGTLTPDKNENLFGISMLFGFSIP